MSKRLCDITARNGIPDHRCRAKERVHAHTTVYSDNPDTVVYEIDEAR
jgi:hypothetical protein